MVPKAVCYLTGDQDPATAWNDIFRYFNRKHNKGDIGYQTGEKIAIKVNFTDTLDFSSPLIESAVNGNADQSYKLIDPTNPQDLTLYQLATNDGQNTPEMMVALLNQLVNVAGVPQSDIYIGDPIRPFTDPYYTRCHGAFPNVHYTDPGVWPGVSRPPITTRPALFYSIHPPECIDGNYESGVEMSDRIADYIYNANYFINLSTLKREGTIGQTMCGKNLFGTMTAPRRMSITMPSPAPIPASPVTRTAIRPAGVPIMCWSMTRGINTWAAIRCCS